MDNNLEHQFKELKKAYFKETYLLKLEIESKNLEILKLKNERENFKQNTQFKDEIKDKSFHENKDYNLEQQDNKHVKVSNK